MKRILKIIPLTVITLFVSVISCQHDDTLQQNEQVVSNISKFIIKMENGDHLRENNPAIYQKLVETSRYTSLLSQAEDGTDTTSFTLDLSTVQIMQRNTYTQYTTSVFDHAEYQAYLINYLFLDFNDGAHYQFLVKYPRIHTGQGVELDPSNAIMERIEGNTLLQTETVGTPRPCLEGVPEIIDTVEQYSCTETPCTGGDRHDWGEECPCANLAHCTMPTRTCGWETVNVWGCSGGGTTGTGSDPTAGGGGNPPNNDEPSDDDPIETVPFVPHWQLVVNCVNSGAMGSFDNSLPLSNDDISWLQSATASLHTIAMAKYIGLNGCEGNKSFIDEATEALINGGEIDFENEIILDESFVNDVKLKCIYDLLKTSNSSLFKNTIGNFINNPKLKINIIKGNCTNTNDACCDDTNLTTTGVVNLIIEDTGGSVLDIASMILHEAIHAEISRYVLLHAPSENINDRPRILQLYKYYKELYNEGDIEHIFMTERYINPIAAALRKLDNDSYPIDYYKSYAWDGLRKWDAGNLLSMTENQNFNNYRTIVEANTSLSCN